MTLLKKNLIVVNDRGQMRTFDRKPRFDEKSRLFKAASPDLMSKDFRSFTWNLKVWLNQGQEGACTGFSTTHDLAALPKVFKEANNLFAQLLYEAARRHDEWPGEDYEGSSLLGTMKALNQLKTPKGNLFIPRYEFAFQIFEAARVLGRKGPLIAGLDWMSEMFDTDENGFIHADGFLAGGHAICVLGQKIHFMRESAFARNDPGSIHLDKSYFILHNSWGQDWGVNGRCKITFKDMQYLMSRQGEFVMPLERAA